MRLLASVTFMNAERELTHFKGTDYGLPRSFAALHKSQTLVIFPKAVDFPHLNRVQPRIVPFKKEKGTERTFRPAFVFSLTGINTYTCAKLTRRNPNNFGNEAADQTDKQLQAQELAPTRYARGYRTDGEGDYIEHTLSELAFGDLVDVNRIQFKLSESDGLDILEDLTRALLTVHQMGNVHGDVKPDNLLLVWKERWRGKLNDFGHTCPIARYLPYCGTPAYFSPEQVRACIRGNLVEDPISCDLYGLGSIAYYISMGDRFPWSLTLEELLTMWVKQENLKTLLEKKEDSREELTARIDNLQEGIETLYAHYQEAFAAFSYEEDLDSEPFESLWRNLLHPDPKARMTLEEVLTWIQKNRLSQAPNEMTRQTSEE
ncbi:MAG: hypothetical protein KDK48_00695 [Chlamydiia bacterium]|nr:hypothetical protein [Chlamydiia bacterium]